MTTKTKEEQEQYVEALQLGSNEVGDSLNGFDQIAIHQQFKHELEDLGALMQQRGLVYVLLRRDGLADGEAFQTVMKMPASAVADRLVAHGGQGEIFPDEPETAEGKGDSLPAELLTSSQHSS